MNNQNKHLYDDIINLPHHVSKRHPQMSPMNRAAQFSPFAALTGHDAAIQETARQTDSFTELDEDRKRQLNEQLWFIMENLKQKPECEITYFQPDIRLFLQMEQQSRSNIFFPFRESCSRIWSCQTCRRARCHSWAK